MGGAEGGGLPEGPAELETVGALEEGVVIAAVAASAEGVMAVVDLVVGEVVIVVVAASAEGAMAVAGVVVAGVMKAVGCRTQFASRLSAHASITLLKGCQMASRVSPAAASNIMMPPSLRADTYHQLGTPLIQHAAPHPFPSSSFSQSTCQLYSADKPG